MATVAKRKFPSQTRLRHVLRDCAFDPRADGPNSIIADAAASNPRYAEDRAIEMIREGQLAVDEGHREHYVRHMRRAIGLLALAYSVRLD